MSEKMDREFIIDDLETENLEEALSLVWRVFLAYKPSDCVDEGTQEFKRFIDPDSFRQKILHNGFRIWVCRNSRDKGKIVGVLATRPACHISLLFVDEEYHRRGIAREMLNHVIGFYKTNRTNYEYKEITVNSSPYAHEAYRKLGFQDAEKEQTINGIRHIPMRKSL